MTVYFLDLFGTFVFAVSGAFRAVKYELDILGVRVLASLTGMGGGIVRDMLLGETPVSALQNETYFFVCIAAAVLVFFAAPHIARGWQFFVIADALGLGIFTAVGALKGYQAGLGIVGVSLAGSLTATGGGLIRDMLVREIPLVISRDVYASAALAGGLVLFGSGKIGASPGLQMTLAVITATGLRLLAYRYGVQLPRVRALPENPTALARKAGWRPRLFHGFRKKPPA